MLTACDRPNSRHRGARGAGSRLQTSGPHRGIGIQPGQADALPRGLNDVEKGLGMDSQQVVDPDHRRIMALKVQGGVVERPDDRLQPFWPFRMAGALSVAEHRSMGIEGEGHGPTLTRNATVAKPVARRNGGADA